jgi:pimeloyl-ACP methyl ester carboxylesterase
MVRRRHVCHISGYDPIGAAWHRIFRRELSVFARTWGVSTAVSEPSTGSGSAQWTVTTSGPGWRVETVYELFLWDDVVRADRAGPLPRRLGQSLAAFFDLIRTGTLARYFSANWQYALFCLFPYVMLLIFAALALALGDALAGLLVTSPLPRAALAVLVGAALFVALLAGPGRGRVQQALDDWIFSFHYVHGRRGDVAARIERFAAALLERAGDPSLDEVVVVGHSMGATLAVETVARALARDGTFGRRGPAVCLLTVGSTLAKFTLHPAGCRIRADARRIVAEPALAWAEYHARSDAISFYKFDPVRLQRFWGDPRSGKPLMRRVHLQRMLSPRSYWRWRLRFMRLHYQFLMANERRAAYDYFMLVCGPAPFSRTVLATRGPDELFAADAALIDPAAPAPAMPPPAPAAAGGAAP